MRIARAFTVVVCILGLAAGARRARADEPAPVDVPLGDPIAQNEQAQAAAAAPAPPPPATPGSAGFKPGKGFRIMSEDGQTSLRVGIQAAYKADLHILADGSRDPTGQFYVIRPRIDGTLFKDWIRFWTSFEFASNPPFLLDSYIEAQPVSEFGIRFGQFWSVMSSHEQLGPQELIFPDWAYVPEYFWPGRDKGVEVFGTTLNKTLDYVFEVTGGSPLRQFSSIPGNWVTQAAVRYSPLGKPQGTEFPYMIMEGDSLPLRMTFSLAGMAGKLQESESNFNPTSGVFKVKPTGTVQREQGGEADVLIEGGRWQVYAEGWLMNTDPFTTPGASAFLATGAFVQGGMAILDKKVDVALQAGWLDPDLKAGPDNLVYGEVTLNYYFPAPNLVLHLRYLLGHQSSPSDPEDAASLPAPPGTINVITLQWNVYF